MIPHVTLLVSRLFGSLVSLSVSYAVFHAPIGALFRLAQKMPILFLHNACCQLLV